MKVVRKRIDVSLIDRPEAVARIHIDNTSIEELADSIKERGLQNAIRVTPRDGRYLTIFGDRRVLAHKLLGLKTIEATIVEATPGEILIDRAIENLQRVDLTPIEEALQYKGLIDEGGLTIDQCAKRLGKRPGSVKRRLEMLAWPVEFRDGVHEGKISMTVAEELLACIDPAHRSYLFEMAVEHGITASVARMWVTDWRKSVAVAAGVATEGRGVQTQIFEKTHFVGCDLCDKPTKYEDLRHVSVCKACLVKLSEVLSTNE